MGLHWEGTGRAVFMAFGRSAFAFCSTCLYVRRSSSDPKAPCLPWLREELAFGCREKGRGPKAVICPCQTGAEFKINEPTFYRLSLLGCLETGFPSPKGLVQGHSWLPQVWDTAITLKPFSCLWWETQIVDLKAFEACRTNSECQSLSLAAGMSLNMSQNDSESQ